MMPILALSIALQGAAIDWDKLAPLPYRAPPIVTAEMNAFVEREAIRRKCTPPADKPKALIIDVAVLVDPSSGIRATVPRAVQCPTVEQYAAALVAGFARNNLLPRSTENEQWYRTTLTFAWTK